ncbi:MAG: mitochondrial benzodiazepine receptor/sensory transduction protein [Patescibacteria group bacterium]|nr:MAG: mitochondrial benzodiazepine receptor/sensory transduction protein [Patescibacteria group bacterium]
MKKILLLTLSVLITFSVGALGSFFTTPSIPTWYSSLNKPFFSPPNWVFGPVWTLLYILMAVSLYLIWINQSPKSQKRKATLLFLIQLCLNALWSVIFFGMRSPEIALIEILLLEAAIIFTVLSFKKISKTAAKLLIPYALWVAFATALNLSIVVLN